VNIIKYLKKFGISVEKIVHKGWEENQRLVKTNDDWKNFTLKNHPMGIFFKWQYVFTSEKGTVSLIKLFDYYRIGEHIFEIFCLEKSPAKEILKDTERFLNREDAIKRVIELLRA
jgi:hypothetical protein